MKINKSTYYFWITVSAVLILIITSFTPWAYAGSDLDLTLYTNDQRWLTVFSSNHILGTDGLGRDMFAVLVVSLRNNIILGVIAASVSVILGGTIGVLLGYTLKEGLLKRSVLIFARLVKSVPLLVWIFLVVFWTELSSLFIPFFDSEIIKMSWIFTILGIIYSFNLALLLMGHIQTLKASQFIEACEFLGLKKTTIIFTHIIWHHSKSLFVSQGSYVFVQSVLLEFTLSFHAIGYGFAKTSLSLGSIFNSSVLEKPMSEHMFLPLVAALILTTIFSFLSQSFEKRYQK